MAKTIVIGRNALKLGRSLRKLVAILFVILGAKLVSTMVDTTPFLGSPQLDYPAMNTDLPFWPQFALLWVIIGLGGGLLAALGMLAWSDEAIEAPNLPRAITIAAASLVLVAGFQLAGFLANGTMGPLYVQQPIVRFALVNGAITSVIITLAWSAACVVVGRISSGLGKPMAFVVSLTGTGLTIVSLILGIALSTGLPPGLTLAWWWPGALILAASVALLVALVPRPDRLHIDGHP